MKHALLASFLSLSQGTGAAEPVAPSPALAPLAFLAGACWQGHFPDGRKTDEHCFDWRYGGRFLRDRHAVRAVDAAPETPPAYQGETLYHVDGEGRAAYWYWNAAGGFSLGTMRPEDDALRFPEEVYEQGGKREIYRSTWQRQKDGGYRVLTERRDGTAWREAWHMDMMRTARRPEELTDGADLPKTGFGWLSELAGACWVGRYPDGQGGDTQCYTGQYGRFLRGSIAMAGKTPYEGDSVLAWDEGRQRILFRHWAMNGATGLVEGQLEGQAILFQDPSKPGRAATRKRWTRQGPDAFQVEAQVLEGDAWQTRMTVVYRREPR